MGHDHSRDVRTLRVERSEAPRADTCIRCADRPVVTEPPHLRATRTGYDLIAEQYAELFREQLGRAPLDRALLAGFAEIVGRDHPDRRVLDVGSGPGVVTAHLEHLGLAVRGIDLSPAMVGLARREHPGIAFDVGEMSRLDAPDADLAGVVAWYSLIHVPERLRPGVLAEFHRVLRPGGYMLVAFQVGQDTLHLDEAFGHEISLDFHRLEPDVVGGLLARAGFDLVARLVRAPDDDGAAAKVPQAFLIASKPLT